MDNKQLFKEWLNEREPILDPYYKRDIDFDFIDKCILSLIDFYELIDDDSYSIDELRNYISLKIKGKYVLSYSSFAKYLNIHNLTLVLCKNASDEVLREFVKQFRILFNDQGIEYKDIAEIRNVALSFYMAKSSQSKSATYKTKLRIQFEENDYSEVNSTFLQPLDFTFNEKVIKYEINYRGIKFKWSNDKQNKNPDFAFVSPDNTLYVGEHKNFKEEGGHQNTVGVEVIDLIKQPSSDEIKWVSYTDGPYFNKEKCTYNSEDLSNKISVQINWIEKLVNETDNYFVGTKTFEKLIKGIRDE